MMSLEDILTRGVEQILPDRKTLEEKLQKEKVRLYLGIDPTGSLLTLGHSVVLRKLQQLADLGHEVILLIGNGTVRIGDPTGRDTTRPELSDAEIEKNFKTWKNQASKILDFDKITIVHNGDWLDKLSLPEIVKLMAKTTVSQLIERDMFQERIKNNLPIYGHELLYPLLQGYDSVALNVDLEIGGTDQTFNMMMGRNLQKIYNDKEKWVLTTPLINGLDGRKMSKSYGNFVALTENPVDMYGKLMRVSDDMIVEYFTLLTDIPLEEITAMEKQMKSGVNPMKFKKYLAKTIASMYHTQKEAQEAENHFEKVIQEKEAPDVIPECTIATGNQNQISGLDLLMQCKLASSKTDAKRLIEQKAITINDSVLSDWRNEIRISDGTIIKAGKRNFVKIRLKKEL